MEQVREFDGEQAYEKMMRDSGEGKPRALFLSCAPEGDLLARSLLALDLRQQ